MLDSGYGSRVVSAFKGLGAPASVAHQASQSVVAGVITAAHFPPALQAAAGDSVRQAFMTGLHAGSFVAAGATFAAAVVALVSLPARARAGHPAGAEVSGGSGHALARTQGGVSQARQVTASNWQEAGRARTACGAGRT